MNKFKNIIKIICVLVTLEIIVLSFTTIYGFKNGFKMWNWIVIATCVSVYLIFALVIIIWENKRKKKVSKDELIVNSFYREQAQLILKSIKNYLNDNKKVYYDLKLYWPFYESVLKRIALGKKFNAKDYGIIEKLNEWQKENYEDQFLMNIYNVLKNNTI